MVFFGEIQNCHGFNLGARHLLVRELQVCRHEHFRIFFSSENPYHHEDGTEWDLSTGGFYLRDINDIIYTRNQAPRKGADD